MSKVKLLKTTMLLLLLCATPVLATEYATWSGGDWDTLSTWAIYSGGWITPSVLPGAADGVQLINTSNANPVTLAAGDNASIDYLYLGSGTTGDTDQLNIYGTLDIDNTGGSGYNTLYFGNWSGGYDVDSTINVYSGATFDIGNIYVVNSNTSAVSQIVNQGGTIAYVSSITLNSSKLTFVLNGGETYIAATSVSGASSSKLNIRFMDTDALLVIDSTLLTNLINAGCIIADSTTVNSSNRSTLLDEDATYSPWICVNMAGGSAPGVATSPSPANSAASVSLTADLSWTAGSGATSHDVYFGTDSTPDSTEFIGNQSGTTYDPGTLTASTTYYWRIDEVNANGTTTGSVWSFTTEAAVNLPGVASSAYPANTATGVSINADLSWTAGSGAISQDVYFGTTSPGTFQGNQTGTTYDPGTLTAATTYYWRIDSVNTAGTTTGTVWSFTTETGSGPLPGTVSEPSPPNSETNIWKDVDLSWTEADDATSYNVYFGIDSTPDFGEYKGNVTATEYTLGTLADDTWYYWRIDAVNASGTTTGAVYSFKTESGTRLTPDQFPIMTWNGTLSSDHYTRPSLDTMRACGFNVAGMKVQTENLDNVADAGLKMVAVDWQTPYGASLPEFETDTTNLSQRVSYTVNTYGSHPGLFAYYVKDEPVTSWFPTVSAWVDAYQAADSSHKSYISLGWPYDWTNYTAYVDMDYLSYDFYGCNEDGTINEYYYPVIESARDAAISNNLPLWNCGASVKMEAMFGFPATAMPNLANLRYQVFTSLAYGVKGIAWFTYFSDDPTAPAPIHMGSKSSFWDDMQNVNMTIHRIGSAYLQLVNCQVFHHPNVPPAQQYQPGVPKGIAYSYYINNITGGDFVVGEFWKAGESGIGYLMVTNKSLTTTANFNITYKWASTEYRVNNATGQWETLESNEKYLAPGEGMLIKFVVN